MNITLDLEVHELVASVTEPRFHRQCVLVCVCSTMQLMKEEEEFWVQLTTGVIHEAET